MTRFLFVVPHFAGHIVPLVGVAAELGGRGHEVAWAGDRDVITALAGDDAEVFPCARPAAEPPAWPDRMAGLAALKFVWEQVLVPIAEAMEPGVRAAVGAFEPDFLVVDQHALAGALVADRLGIPWATSASTSAELGNPLAALPKVEQWIQERMRGLQRRFGDPRIGEDLRFSPDLVLAFTTPELCGVLSRPNVAFVGASVTSRPARDDFPWHLLDPGRRLVLVTLGTVSSGPRFLAECVRTLQARRDRIQAVIADPDGSVAGAPPDLIVRPRVPLLALLGKASTIVCHAGHNTVCEAMEHAVPVVVAPIRDGQPIVARQVARAGVGVELPFFRATADRIGAAIDTVLDDASFRERAAAVRASFRRAGGACAAADHLEKLADAMRSGAGKPH
ncbi:glycosyltransferase family 1 protein [Amycolatopsis sp. K13G38]|uniref:Glycosyltransferase family 1 protein n=1 Tax=Amycolatopsis acididurans TaxID=2724524 RepID=A0ABX1JI27_9PSEU|nr:glycosyltransferase [Amycolatopsis acididurans]NKQ57892.1 glycosyltransferase family 1 protein [Amycolatopsis acididurans]